MNNLINNHLINIEGKQFKPVRFVPGKQEKLICKRNITGGKFVYLSRVEGKFQVESKINNQLEKFLGLNKFRI